MVDFQKSPGGGGGGGMLPEPLGWHAFPVVSFRFHTPPAPFQKSGSSLAYTSLND